MLKRLDQWPGVSSESELPLMDPFDVRLISGVAEMSLANPNPGSMDIFSALK